MVAYKTSNGDASNPLTKLLNGSGQSSKRNMSMSGSGTGANSMMAMNAQRNRIMKTVKERIN